VSDPLKPSPSLLCKLGSIIVHSEEAASPGGHHFDRVAVQTLLADAEVVEWMEAMRKMAMLPVERS
jgi:hypothetical protein